MNRRIVFILKLLGICMVGKWVMMRLDGGSGISHIP